MFTGNRGCLVDDDRQLVRHHQSSLWIICEASFRGWKHPLDQPHRWTPVFFLDDAVGLAAGHRPCGFCRPDAYRSYRDAISAADSTPQRWSASDINRQLATERLSRGRGLDRAGDRRLWSANIADLPSGAVILWNEHAHLVGTSTIQRFTFDGWAEPTPRPSDASVEVITPPLSIAALTNGFALQLHPTAVV
jgi:hypothetical protein